MTGSRSSHLSRVAAARTTVTVAGATGALGAALAIGMNTTSETDAAVWVPGTPNDNAQYQAPDDDRDDDRDDDDEQRALPPTPHVSTAQPGEQHAQSNGS